MKTPEKKSGSRIVRRVALAFLGGIIGLEILLRVAGYYYKSSVWGEFEQRQAPTAEHVTILALGESTTGGLWVRKENSYPKQLEQLLRTHYETDHIRVVVPLHIGQNTSQMVHRYQQYLTTYQPALVIIMAGVNNSWSLAESNLGEFMPSDDWRTYIFRVRRWADDIKVLRLVRLLVSGSVNAVQNLRSDLEGKPRFTHWPPKSDSLVSGIGPEPFIQLWRSDIGRMIEEAKAAGAGVILMTYPNYDSPPISEWVSMSQKWSVPLVENHKSFDMLIEQGRAEEFLFEDLYHPNARGYAIVADNALRAVVATGILDNRLRGATSN